MTAKSARRVLVLALAVGLLAGAASAQKQKQKPTKPDEKNPQYQYEKGVIALRYGLPDEAIRYANLAISLDPKHYGGHSLLGNAYFQKGDFAAAATAFEQAVKLRPELAEAHAWLGLAYVEAGEVAKAEPELKKACDLGGDAVAHYNLAKVYYKENKLDAALEYVQKSIQKDGKSPGAYNLKGVVLNQLSRYAEAAGSFQAGLVLAPDDVNLLINLGIAFYNNQEPAKAQGTFEKVLPLIKDPSLKEKIEGYLKAIKGQEERRPGLTGGADGA